MFRTAHRTLAAAALVLGLGAPAFAESSFAAPASTEEVLDVSNSASAVGNPLRNGPAVTREAVGASPTDDSNSASARGSAFRFPVARSVALAGAPAVNWSNSDSATENPVPALAPRALLAAR